MLTAATAADEADSMTASRRTPSRVLARFMSQGLRELV